MSGAGGARAQLGDCKDRSLAAEGQRRIEWADANMPVLAAIRARWEQERPLEGVRISACLHVTTETANLVRTLAAGGATVRLCASNPLSTQDDVAAALNEVYGIPTFAIRGEPNEVYYRHIHQVLDVGPHLSMDDGADLVNTLHTQRKELLEQVAGGTEETTTGVIRLRAMAAEGVLRYPIVAVNDALTKHMFDNRYGTGQSTIDGILRATNYLLAGSTFVVVGYGWCGRGIAMRARGMGAQVVVVEVDPFRALEAAMEGYRVLPMRKAAEEGDIFVTATGNMHVIDVQHFDRMKDGALLANAGHFDVEINVKALRERSKERREARRGVEEFLWTNGRRLRLLAEGRLVNLGAAEGHPAHVMDMSFANQALSARWLVERGGIGRGGRVAAGNGAEAGARAQAGVGAGTGARPGAGAVVGASAEEPLAPGVYPVPAEIDREIAKLKLTTLGIEIEELTDAQRRYLASWEQGT